MPVQRPKLSLAMIVKNEERCLARCLQSAKPYVDEILVADTGSTDATAKIAGEFGARIVNFKWIHDFAAARNFAIGQSTGDWILVMDADEWLSETLGSDILRFICGEPAVGRVRQVSEFERNHLKMRSQSVVPRVFPRGGHYEGRIHEQLVSPWPRVSLLGELWHDGYLEIERRATRNIKLLEAELGHNPDSAYFLYQIAIEYHSIGQTRNAFDCLQRAFANVRPGDPFAPNLAVDFLYTLIDLKDFEKGLEVIAKSEESLAGFPDFFLARGLFYMNLVRSNPAKYISSLPKIEESFQRCLVLGDVETGKSVRGAGTFLASYNLGVFYHVFGNPTAARPCLQKAADQGYEPAIDLLKKTSPPA